MGDQYFIRLEKPIIIKGEEVRILIGKSKDPSINLDDVDNKPVVLSLVYFDGLDSKNYVNYSFENYRGDFLQGDFIKD